jgi:hypothetical protein
MAPEVPPRSNQRWKYHRAAIIAAMLVLVLSVFWTVWVRYSAEKVTPQARPPIVATPLPTVPPPNDDGPVTGSAGKPPSPPASGVHPAPGSAKPLPTEKPPAPVNLEPFRQYSKQLVNGVVGFDYPQRMKVGDRTDVNLRVSVQKAVQDLRDSLTREGRDPIVEPVKLSSRMKAELRGFSFEIKPLSSAVQIIDADEDTMWRWDVRATDAGKHRLTVTLTALIEMEGGEGARDVSTFYREVEVEALTKTWWESTRNIAKEYGPSRDILWPAIGTGIAAVWAVLFTRRKARQKRGRRK